MSAAGQLDRGGFLQQPDWLRAGARPPVALDAKLDEWQHGWQFHASSPLLNTISERPCYSPHHAQTTRWRICDAGPHGHEGLAHNARQSNAGPYGQCRAVRSMQGRTVNVGLSTFVQVVLFRHAVRTPREAPHNGASARHCTWAPNHPDRHTLGSHGRRQFFFCSAKLPREFQGKDRQVLEVRHEAVNSRDKLMEARAWKAFCLLPLLLFRRPGNEHNVSKEDVPHRFDPFERGHGDSGGRSCGNVARVSEAKVGSPVEHRGEKAAQKVRLGEITRARQCHRRSSESCPSTFVHSHRRHHWW